MSWRDEQDQQRQAAITALLDSPRGQQYLSYANRDRGFAGWLLVADATCARRFGMSIFDLADGTWRIEREWAPWTVRFPMCDPPYLSNQDMLDAARAAGLEPPRLYELGFSHNNCGGVCVRGDQKHWLHLLEVFPDRYAEAEEREQQLRAELGDVAILRERRGGVSRPLTLTELRRRHSGQQQH